MSKRPNFPQLGGDRKKPKLDFSVSDHNFPLSQNAGPNKAAETDNWDDDIDDEMLLQASQACEEQVSMLPDYSQFQPPVITSTQVGPRAIPGPSKGTFTFKRPNTGAPNTVSTLLKNKCDLISSPLRGMSTAVSNVEANEVPDNLNDTVLNTRDTDFMYKQLLHLTEENKKLRSEQSKLLEKCVTKEGEASILRTQLKSFQVAADNARLEKLKAQEQAQIQWSDKLKVANDQLHELQTHLDFKNMEIINLKEKCKMLESNKIKLTQITVAGNDMSRLNNNTSVVNNFSPSQLRRQKTATSGVQTENSPVFVKLNKACRIKKTKLTQILPLVMNSATDHQHSILDYNEKLKRPADLSPNKCRIFSTFHRLLSNSISVSSKTKNKINISCIYEDLSCIVANNNNVDKVPERYINIFNTTKIVLEDVQSQLETVSKRLTSAFQKEIDKNYMESTSVYNVVDENDLIAGKALFKEEQAILARRLTTILQNILEDSKTVEFFNKVHRLTESKDSHSNNEFIELIYRICILLDHNSCALLYSGLLLSITLLIENLLKHSKAESTRMLEIIKRIISSRGMLFVPCRLLGVVVSYYKMGVGDSSAAAELLCSENGGNIKVDHERGVLMFKKETCLLQVLLKQVESALKCMEKQQLSQQVIEITQHLLQLHASFISNRNNEQSKSRCECDRVLLQILMYALKICAATLDRTKSVKSEEQASPHQMSLLSVCRSGLQVVYQAAMRDVEFVSQLRYHEGHLIQFCEYLRGFDHSEYYRTMLSEMQGMFQAAADEPRDTSTWLRTFDNFSLRD